MAKAIGWEGVFPGATTRFKRDSELGLDAAAMVMDGLKLPDVGLKPAA